MIEHIVNSELLAPVDANAFDAIQIGIASPETIRSWSFGEVKSSETLNYRSQRPEENGLFCEKIFGPVKDNECACGLYKNNKNSERRVERCPKCGVPLLKSSVRRERMGHIDLSVPVAHVLFYRGTPNFIALMLGVSNDSLQRIIAYEQWIVTDPGDTQLMKGQPLDANEYAEARHEYGFAFSADTGAPAIKELLSQIDLDQMEEELKAEFAVVKNKQERKTISSRIQLVEGFKNGNTRPEYMILDVLPVLPPDLRPLVPLGGGRFASSDLNDLYRRVLNRNARLKDLMASGITPELVIRNEKRMLQEIVDALFENHKIKHPVTAQSGRVLKSFTDMLKGKQGRFRQNLLGKRVDYSGRSVIVVGPELKINQCGIPKRMAMTLFEPFVIRRIKDMNLAQDSRKAKALIERNEPVVWDILEHVTKGHPVMLNRAPTLHRLSIQAFELVLIEGNAIRLHPLVCTAFNADFDGDQMAVHVPLSNEAQLEVKLLMLSPNNIFSPANGKPIVSPTHDITLGSYYLTYDPQNIDKAKHYRDYFEVLYAKETGYLKMHDAVIIPNPDYGKDTVYGNKTDRFITTTPGRCIFNEIWDKRLGFFNRQARKKDLGEMISKSYQITGHDATIKLLDDLKDLGYKHATLAGFSVSVDDLPIPEKKGEIIQASRDEIAELNRKLREGEIDAKMRKNRVQDIWQHTSDEIAEVLFESFKAESAKGNLNPIWAMMDSGARGNKDQVRQLAGMRGLMAKPNGEIIEQPVIACFREGLSMLEYFISTHGARKGLADTALKTANSGYMTRRLVDVAQNVICREDDCGTTRGVWISAILEGEKAILSLRDRIVGRYSAQDIYDRGNDNELIVAAGDQITPAIADRIEACGITKVYIRSALTCETRNGVCAKCYGRNLASDREARVGDALGIIAAQSIGEPGTQLTMRTFHIGGTAKAGTVEPVLKANHDGTLKFVGLKDVVTRTVKDADGNKVEEKVVVSKNVQIIIYDHEDAVRRATEARRLAEEEANALGTAYNAGYDYMKDAIEETQKDSYNLEVGSVLDVADGDSVRKGDKLVHWDPGFIPILAGVDGVVQYEGLNEGLTWEKLESSQSSDRTKVQRVVKEHGDKDNPMLVLIDENGERTYYSLPVGAIFTVAEGDEVKVGSELARVSRQASKTQDITGGLPRVSEIFEARPPQMIAEISKIDGVVESVTSTRMKYKVIIKDPVSGMLDEHNSISQSKHLIVSKGDRVVKGQRLTDGMIAPSDLLAVKGKEETERYLVDEVQRVYRQQSVEINDKHIEIIVRQMMQKVMVTDAGSTDLMVGTTVNRNLFDDVNRKVMEEGKTPARSVPVLSGITKASLETDSFISAASFQDTTRILTRAAAISKIDTLDGFKENVITEHIIPAGTGNSRLQALKLVFNGEEIPEDQMPRRRDSIEERMLKAEEICRRNEQEDLNADKQQYGPEMFEGYEDEENQAIDMENDGFTEVFFGDPDDDSE